MKFKVLFAAAWLAATSIQTAYDLERPSKADLERGFEILQLVVYQSRGTAYSTRDFLPAELAPYDPDLALELAELDGKASDDELAVIISTLGLRDPARAGEWAPARLQQIKDVRKRLAATLGWTELFATTQPELAIQTLQQGRAALKPKATSADDVFDIFYVGQLAFALKQPDATAIFQNALSSAKELEKEQGNKILPGLIEALIGGIAGSDPALAEKAALELPVGVRAHALSRAIPWVARHNVPAALRLLERLALEEAPPEPVPDARGIVRRRLNWQPEFAFGLAAKAIIPEVGKTDPSAALILARRVKSPHHYQEALALAAQSRPKNEALELLREAAKIVEAQDAYSEKIASLSRLAAQAYDLDPQAGRELFEKARQALKNAEANGPVWDERESASLAFYAARFEPQQSRAQLEADFKRLSAVEDKKTASWNMARVAQAMTAVDVGRALEMARSISEENLRFDTQRKIAQYVLAPESVRRTLPFGRWGASDNWMPGTPTEW